MEGDGVVQLWGMLEQECCGKVKEMLKKAAQIWKDIPRRFGSFAVEGRGVPSCWIMFVLVRAMEIAGAGGFSSAVSNTNRCALEKVTKLHQQYRRVGPER
jgi:hypothetical protein